MTIIEDKVRPPSPDKPKPAAKPAKSQAVVTQLPPPVTPMTFVDRAIEKGLTGQDLKEIMDLQERWEAGQNRKAFDVAMANAQAEMPKLVKNRLVEYGEGAKRTSYKHEDLAEVISLITPVLKNHGLAVRFRTEQLDGGQVRVYCLLTGHGHREETSLQSSRDSSGGKNDIQAVGSVVTYLERYTLKAALGLAAAHDDDGRGSEGKATAITALQLKELEALIVEVDANEVNVRKACHVATLAEMTQAQFEKAKGKLETMRAPL